MATVKAALAVVAALAMTVVVVRMGGERQALLEGLEKDGRTASGFVTGATETRRRGASTYSIQYGYRVNGTGYQGSIGATREQARAARVHDPITITYDPANPGKSIGTSVARAQKDLTLAKPVAYGAMAVLWGFALWSLFAAAARGE